MTDSVPQNYSLPEKDLLCPVCLGIPPDKNFQCKNGHNFCKSCTLKLTHCPVCSSSLDWETEAMVASSSPPHDATKISRPDKEYGCSEMTCEEDTKTQAPVHPCKHLGFPRCEHLHRADSSMHELVLHLKTAHGTEMLVLQNQSSKIFPTSSQSAKTVWTKPILFDLSTRTGSEYVIVTPHAKSTERKDLELWFTAVYLGQSKAEAYELSVELSKWNDDEREVPEAECRQPVISINGISKGKTRHFIKYRVHHDEHDSKAFIKVGIKRKPSSAPEDENNQNLKIDSAARSGITAETQTLEALLNAIAGAEIDDLDLALPTTVLESQRDSIVTSAGVTGTEDDAIQVSSGASVVRTIFFTYFVAILATTFLTDY